MAKKFLTPLGLVSLSSDPATGSEGQLYFNTTSDVIKIYSNGSWSELSGGGGSVIYSPEQPDISTLDIGTIWMDSNAEITSIGNTADLDSYLTIISASGTYATKAELNNINLTSTINTASAAAYASASAYTNSAISSFQALPNQSGNNGKYLTTNGSSTSWVPLDLNSAIQTASAAAVTYLVDGAPEALNTLNELSEALNDNADILDSLLTISAASAAYLPLSASASFYRWTKTYSASASVISGVDDNSISLSYNAGYIQLFINGVMLDPSEYTATSGSAITVSTPVLSGEVVDIFAFLNSTSVNTYSQTQIDNKYNNLTRWKKAYSASATVISGVDDNSNTLSYLSGYEQFYLNGILLTPITDYARTSASVVTLSTPLISGDIVEIINTQPFNVADVYTTSQANSTFLTQASASSTYLTQLSASSTYQRLDSNVNSFRNLLINGKFDVWQRGTSFGNDVYNADRWRSQNVSSVSRSNDAPSGYTYSVEFGNSSATFPVLDQRIEAVNVRHLTDKTVTLSFWAKNISGTSNLYAELFYPTGGVDNYSGTSPVSTPTSIEFATTLSNSWTKYSGSFVISSNVSNGLMVRIVRNNVSAATTRVTGVQLEVGSVATPFEERFIGTELELCERYYEISSGGGYIGNSTNGAFYGFQCNFRTVKRVSPVVTRLSTVGSGNVNTPYAENVNQYGFRAMAQATGSNANWSSNYSAEAEL